MLPEAEYLRLIGEVAYRVSYLEWGVIGDLFWINDREPLPDIDLKQLMSETTWNVGDKVEKALSSWEDRPGLYAWGTAAAAALKQASGKRNHVLHARPATTEDACQRLLRHRFNKDGSVRDRFWVSEEHLRELVAELDQLQTAIEPLRLLNVGLDES